jgi:hypothetical protein
MDDGGEDAATDGVPIGAGEFATGAKPVMFVPVLGYL